MPIFEILPSRLPLGPFRPTIEEWKNEFPWLFKGEKKLLLVEKPQYSLYSSYKHERWKARKWIQWFKEKFLEKVESFGRIDDFLIQIVSPPPSSSREFYINEPFFEFMAGTVLKQRGYLVSSPITIGADLVGFKGPALFECLKGTGAEFGAFVVELLLNKVFGKPTAKVISPPEQDEAIVIEAESTPARTSSYSDNAGFGQVSKHLGGYNRAYVTGPLCRKRHKMIGTISFLQNGKLFFNEAKLIGPKSLEIMALVKEYVRALLR